MITESERLKVLMVRRAGVREEVIRAI